MKLALGTVQFGLVYGINNQTGIPAMTEVNEIFGLAAQSGIDTFDTASLYGDAEKITGALTSGRQAKIITKLPGVTSAKEVSEALHLSLNQLGRTSVYGYLVHDPQTLLNIPEIWNELEKSKAEGLVKKIGYSLYTPEELTKLLERNMRPDLVQIPYSILDRKFEASMGILKELNTEIHVRSVFLQGLYFMNTEHLPEKLVPLKPVLEKLNELCSIYHVAKSTLALNFAAQHPLIDKIVIGVEKADQLRENINQLNSLNIPKELFDQIKDIQVAQPQLLIPSNW